MDKESQLNLEQARTPTPSPDPFFDPPFKDFAIRGFGNAPVVGCPTCGTPPMSTGLSPYDKLSPSHFHHSQQSQGSLSQGNMAFGKSFSTASVNCNAVDHDFQETVTRLGNLHITPQGSQSLSTYCGEVGAEISKLDVEAMTAQVPTRMGGTVEDCTNRFRSLNC